jgi:predicted DNA-binding protein
MERNKISHRFEFPADIAEKLSDITRQSGSTKTQIVIDAISAFIDTKAANAIDERYTHRLDRLLSRVESLYRNQLFMSEVLGTFVQHQLTLVAHQPPFEPETAKLGRLRYEALLDLVSRRIARPASTRSGVDDGSRTEVAPSPQSR